MVPKHNTFISNGFLWYTERLLKKTFDGVGISVASLTTWKELMTAPKAIIYGTHSSWWDVMMAAFISKRTGLTMFAPMDAAQLKKYWILKSVGLFPVTSEMALSYMRTVRDLFVSDERRALFITPQAEFVSNRREQPEFKRGLEATARLFPEIPVYAVSIEYEFWNESRPVILFAISKVNSTNVDTVNEILRQHLQLQTNNLLQSASRRDEHEWEWLVRAKSEPPLMQNAELNTRSYIDSEEDRS